MTNWKGSIVEESLSDNRVLNGLNILKLQITSETIPDSRWHIYFISASDDDIKRLHIFLKQKWYMRFWEEDRMKILFKDKIFDVSVSNKETWKEAIEYGLSCGIPKEQLDFVAD